MTKLNQVLAIEGGVRSKTDLEGAELLRRVQKDALVSNGLARTYTPLADDGLQLPPQSTLVQVKVPDVLDRLAVLMTRLFDVVFTKETTNTLAKADLVIDGTPLLTDVPVTYLLFLGHQLDELASFVDKLPTLDPANEWNWDENTGTYVTPEIETITSTKTRVNHVLSPAVPPSLPAQVQVFNDDVPVGRWHTRKSSGAIFATRKTELAERVEKLRAAVKMARETANLIEVTDRKAGEVIFSYLLAP